MLQKLKSKIKRELLLLSGQYRHLRKSASVPLKWYGNTYGGFYACPSCINEDSVVYSFGIGEDISFDESIIKEHKCEVFGFDPTPRSVTWINLRSGDISSRFRFFEYGIAEKTGIVDFFLPKNTDHVSGSFVSQINVSQDRVIKVQMKSLADIAGQLGHRKIDILKMDIEGAEYRVLESILNSDVIIDQILIEFHDRFFEDGVSRTAAAVEQLKKHDFLLCGISDSTEELSFINKRIIG